MAHDHHRAELLFKESKWRDQYIQYTFCPQYPSTIKEILPLEEELREELERAGHTDLTALPQNLLGSGSHTYHSEVVSNSSLLWPVLDAKFAHTRLHAANPEDKEVPKFAAAMVKALIAFHAVSKGSAYAFSILLDAMKKCIVVPRDIWAPDYASGKAIQKVALKLVQQQAQYSVLYEQNSRSLDDDKEREPKSPMGQNADKVYELKRQFARLGGFGDPELIGIFAQFAPIPDRAILSTNSAAGATGSEDLGVDDGGGLQQSAKKRKIVEEAGSTIQGSETQDRETHESEEPEWNGWGRQLTDADFEPLLDMESLLI